MAVLGSLPKHSPNTPSGTGGDFTIKESEVAAMTSAEYDKYSDEIDKAIKEGRFDYDLTNAAKEAARG